MKTKPFNLQAAINGAKLVTRDGREAKFIAYVPEARAYCRVIAMLPDWDVRSYYENGMYLSIDDALCNLFLAVQTRSINGHEYPEPERVEPEEGAECWAASPASEDFVIRFWFANKEKRHQRYLKHGLVHLSKENAKHHAIAEILAGGGEV